MLLQMSQDELVELYEDPTFRKLTQGKPKIEFDEVDDYAIKTSGKGIS
jgi:hypothetical protein